MEIASIKGDTVLFIYHPAESTADVGQQFSILEVAEKTEGIVAQVISNDSLEYAGLQQEMIQHLLEERFSETTLPLDRERGMGEIKSLKVAAAKIRKRIKGGDWVAWDGWIPTRNVEVTRIEATDLLERVVPTPEVALRSFSAFNSKAIEFSGPRFNMVNVITGVKGSGKSHVAKHVLLAMANSGVPCIVFDLNGEYVAMPHAQVLRWGDNFLPQLAEIGHWILELTVRSIHPFAAGSPSESRFENSLPLAFASRRQYCSTNNQPFTIDVPFLRGRTWDNNDLVEQAIQSRLQTVDRRRLFASGTPAPGVITSLALAYDQACNGQPIVFDMRELGGTMQEALVKAMISLIERICQSETDNSTGRYPFAYFEEAHFYVSDDAILNIITRGRHIGMGSVFITNTPQKLPDTVFRQLDNLFLLQLSHKDDIRNVSRNSFTDDETIESFATRMPEHHALIIGSVTDRYPLVVHIDELPSGVPTTGRTRSTWDRMGQP